MAKRYRRKKNEPKAKKKPFSWKRFFLLLGILIPVFSFYQIGVYFGWPWLIHVYSITAGVLAVLYVIANRGVFTVPRPEELSDVLTPAEKAEIIAEVTRRKKRSMVLLYALIPILITLTYDVVYLFLTVTLGYTF